MSDPPAKTAPQRPPAVATPGQAATPQSPTVHFRQRAARSGFTQLPNVVLESTRLSANAKVVYALLCRHAWQDDHAFPHQAGLAARLRSHVRTVQRALKELRLLGLLTVERRGLQLPNVYWLEPLDTFADEEAEWGGAGTPTDTTPVSHQDVTPVSHQDVTPVSHQDVTPVSRPIRSKKTQVKEDTHKGGCAVADAPEHDAPTDPTVELVDAMRKVGLSKPVAKRLVEKYGAAACQQQLDWLPLRKPRDPAATLRRAVEESWLPPDGNPKLRLPGERPYAPLPPPELPTVGPESDAARLKVKAELALRGLAGKVAAIGGQPR